jgi:carbon storage regulator
MLLVNKVYLSKTKHPFFVREYKAMLVLSRKQGERIQIGDSICVTVLDSRNGKVRLGIDGPASVPIHREEVYQRIRQESKRQSPRVASNSRVV